MSLPETSQLAVGPFLLVSTHGTPGKTEDHNVLLHRNGNGAVRFLMWFKSSAEESRDVVRYLCDWMNGSDRSAFPRHAFCLSDDGRTAAFILDGDAEIDSCRTYFMFARNDSKDDQPIVFVGQDYGMSDEISKRLTMLSASMKTMSHSQPSMSQTRLVRSAIKASIICGLAMGGSALIDNLVSWKTRHYFAGPLFTWMTIGVAYYLVDEPIYD